MPGGQRKYNDEFKNTILSCITTVKYIRTFKQMWHFKICNIISGKKSKTTNIDNKGTTITAAKHKTMLKKFSRLEEKNKISKKAMAIFAKKKLKLT
ncbi:MAG: transposase [Clostridium butyricum]|nr:transposase [Thermoanaerobacterium sp.]MDK2829218.1 transposase [Clostridium butyricum]MDK2840367.1 transposase [Thermosipho sp. (in: thermotogales)]TCW36472.1 transposase [Thermohydrogenium kirishiense]